MRRSQLSFLTVLAVASMLSGCLMADSGGYYGYRGDDFGSNYYRDAGRRNGWHRGDGETEGWGRRDDFDKYDPQVDEDQDAGEPDR